MIWVRGSGFMMIKAFTRVAGFEVEGLGLREFANELKLVAEGSGGTDRGLGVRPIRPSL